MSKQDKVSRSPLLYIAQPTEYKVEAIMQGFATYKKNEVKKKNKSLNPNVITNSNAKNEDSQSTHNLDEEDLSKRKTFKDLSVEEKIIYLTTLPKQMPSMKCEVLANNERYRGVIQEYSDDSIIMKTTQRPHRVEIKVSHIQDIKLRGF